jgi:mRNA-degrading endonuclease RelE of RelBE toxin-antitoxin system
VGTSHPVKLRTSGRSDARLTRLPGMTRIIVIMAKQRPYTLVYAEETKRHVRAIDSKFHSLIREAIEEQLLHEPGVETRNRKPLRPPAAFSATWEIRFGPDNRFRVFYDILEEEREVQILAIGVKRSNRLIIGGEEIEL